MTRTKSTFFTLESEALPSGRLSSSGNLDKGFPRETEQCNPLTILMDSSRDVNDIQVKWWNSFYCFLSYSRMSQIFADIFDTKVFTVFTIPGQEVNLFYTTTSTTWLMDIALFDSLTETVCTQQVGLFYRRNPKVIQLHFPSVDCFKKSYCGLTSSVSALDMRDDENNFPHNILHLLPPTQKLDKGWSRVAKNPGFM